MSSKNKEVIHVFKSFINNNKVADAPTIITSEAVTIPESKQTLGEDLRVLKDQEPLFIYQLPQTAEKFLNVPNNYEIKHTNGQKIFSVIETTDDLTRRLFKKDQPFKLKILNSQGKNILDLVGDAGIRGLRAYVKLQRHAAVVGKVEQVNPLFACCNFSPSYNVTTGKGEPVYSIVRERGKWTSCVFTNDFLIYCATKKCEPVGKVSRQNDMERLVSKEMRTFDSDKYTLIFYDSELSCKIKALLIAAVIMLDFQYFEGREGSYTGKFCVAAAILVLLLLVIAVVVIRFVI